MQQDTYRESTSLMTRAYLACEHFGDFLQEICLGLSTLFLHNPLEKERIRKAVIDFLGRRGMRAVVLFGEQGLKIQAVVIDSRENAYVDFLTRFLEHHNYASRLRSGDTTCLQEIFLSMQETSLRDEALIKDIVRSALKKVLGLSPRDGLFFHNIEPLVRSFDFALVQHNAQIRELKKPSHTEPLLDEETRARITQALLDNASDTNLLLKQITQELLSSRLTQLGPIELLGGFSFLCIQQLSKQLGAIVGAGFSVRAMDCYCVELYRERLGTVCEEIAWEVLHALDARQEVRDFVGLFDGRKHVFNGREFYTPVIEDEDSRLWGITEIERILHEERDRNAAIQAHRLHIAQAQKRLLAIEQELRINEEKIHEKQARIHDLSCQYEEKKAQSLSYEKADVETKNLFTKRQNALLEQKIQVLDSMTALTETNSLLQTERQSLENAQKNAQAEIALITRENTQSMRNFTKLLRALCGCIRTTMWELERA